ncbi:stAR-related lipid transfer protein 9 isoform X1 [Mauremys reevesii]|uniref:stAR-related lipid transfer protein 9 isoform X1 n=2 Tax=Mauremys reevesii TaxID=260615 RepID=UPI00193FA376|nr:stAR-related lipid transfer protein 9 isoform X1 [Mauremys reevesii]
MALGTAGSPGSRGAARARGGRAAAGSDVTRDVGGGVSVSPPGLRRDMANVKVAVRVRPLSKRENAEGGRIIVEVDEKVAKVRNIKVDNRLEGPWDTREKIVAFGFDFCYWSVDPEDPKYASQEVVFQDLGTSVLSGAFKGYNICLFAYGQTGSGKTYTMMGTPASIGLTPRICEGIFSREDDYSEQPTSCRVEVSFLEIYNERVRDLLKQSNQKKPYTLRVREHPETGPYVQGLSQHLVTDYKQAIGLLEEGIANRITAATHVHDASSRSHAIFTIQYTQAILENNLPSEIASKINLVDLAGSERADPSYCKDRITEGANINKSLVTLGIVISTLAQNSQMFSSCQSINSITSEGDNHVSSHSPGSVSGTRRQAYIPYRDSILTWLLKDSLGGNSKTIMIATISPASSSYNETMSTLRYASNAKNIINKPRVNEDANVKLIRELREEIDRLKTMLMSFELRNSSPSWSDDRDGNLTELVLQNEMKIEQLTKDWSDKWTDRKVIMEEYSVDINKEKAGVTIDSNLPHLMAVNDDILSTGVVLYHLREGTTKIGRCDSDQEQDIVLQGQWIERNHCIIDNKCGLVTLRPVQGAYCTVNGQEVTGACRLSQGGLVVLGKAHKFRFNHPAEAAILRQRRLISEASPVLSSKSLEWLDLDGDFAPSPSYIFSPLEKESQKHIGREEGKHSAEMMSREIDSVHEEYKQKLRDQEAFHRERIQQQQLYIEDLKQQILAGQIKAERELEYDQALINQQIRENQQWLINEKKRLASLQPQQREFAVQTESKSYAEAEVQNTVDLEICPSLVEQNRKRLVQLELLRRYSLKKAERNIGRKKVKFQLERIVKKQKLLEAKRNLEQLEASYWLSEDNLKQSQVLNQNTTITSWDYKLQRRRKSLGSSSLQHRRHSFCNPYPPHVPIYSSFLKRETTSELSTSPNTYKCHKGNAPRKTLSLEYLPRTIKDNSRRDDHNDERYRSFAIQRQLTKKQKTSLFGNEKGAEKDCSDSVITLHINKDDKKMEKLDDRLVQTEPQSQTSKNLSPDQLKKKGELETFITGTQVTKVKVLGDSSQPTGRQLEESEAQASHKKSRMDLRGDCQDSLPESFTKEVKKSIVRGKPPSGYLSQTARNLKREPKSSLPSHDRQLVEKQEFLMTATSVGNLNKINIQTPLRYIEKKWHSAEVLSVGISKTATDLLGNWQEDDENDFSDTDSSYSVDSLSCAYAKALTEQLKQEDSDRNKCITNPEDSESDDSQMSQDSLIEKENKAKKRSKKRFHKLVVHQEPVKFYKGRYDHHISPLVTSSTSRSGLAKTERSFSLDSLADAEEVLAEDLVEESKSDSSDEVPAEIFWRLQSPRSPAIQTEEYQKPGACDKDVKGTNYDLKQSSSFYLDTQSQSICNNTCKQPLKEMKVCFLEQEGSVDQRLNSTGGNSLTLTDALSSYDSKSEISSPRIAVPSFHKNLRFRGAHLSKLECWLKKDDLKQSAAEVSFVSGYKQLHSISHLSHGVNEINATFSSDGSEIPLPETTHFEIDENKVPESGSLLSKMVKENANSDENSVLESQDVRSLFVSSIGPSTSCVPISTFSAKRGYYEDVKSVHPKHKQLTVSSTYGSTVEYTQQYSCLKKTSMTDCLLPVSGKEEGSLPTIYPELPKDQDSKKISLISTPSPYVLQQRNDHGDSDLEDNFFRTIEKADMGNECDNLITESKTIDSNTRDASVNAATSGLSKGLSPDTASIPTVGKSSEKQGIYEKYGQLFAKEGTSTSRDEGFFLSDLSNKNRNTGIKKSYTLQTSVEQGENSAGKVGLLSYRGNNFESVQKMDYQQLSAGEITIDKDFSSERKPCHSGPATFPQDASYDQFTISIDTFQKELVCNTSRDILIETALEAPSFRDTEEYEQKEENPCSQNNCEIQRKFVLKNDFLESLQADNPESCLSLQVLGTTTLCPEPIRKESRESKEKHNLSSHPVGQERSSSKYRNLVVDELRYLNVNLNGKNTALSTAGTCEIRDESTSQSNSNEFYYDTAKTNLFLLASETEKYNTQLQDLTAINEICDTRSNLSIENNVEKSCCSGTNSNCLCTMCCLKSKEQKNNMYKKAEGPVGYDAAVLSDDTQTKKKSFPESREESETAFSCMVRSESDFSGEVLFVGGTNNYVKTNSGKVLEHKTVISDTAFQEGSPSVNNKSECTKKAADPEDEIILEETLVPYQSKKVNTTEEIAKLVNSVIKLESNILEIKARQTETEHNYSVVEAQCDIGERSRNNLENSSLVQRSKEPSDLVACKDHHEFYKKLHTTVLCEEAEKEQSGVYSGGGVGHTDESKTEEISDSCIQTSSFHENKRKANMKINYCSTETEAASKSIPSSVCSSSSDFSENTIGFLDTYEELKQTNRIIENVLNTKSIARTIPGSCGEENSLENGEKEQKNASSDTSEICITDCLVMAHENFFQENRVDGSITNSKMIGSEEQTNVKDHEMLVSTGRGELHTNLNVSFTQEIPALDQMYSNRDNSEKFIIESEIPERYFTASNLEEQDVLSVDTSGLTGGSHDAIEKKGKTGIMNKLVEDINNCDSSADDSAVTEKNVIRGKSGRLIKENSHTDKSSYTDYTDYGVSEDLDVNFIGNRPDNFESDPMRFIAQEKEKTHQINLVQMAKADVINKSLKTYNTSVFRTDKERKAFKENIESRELTASQNQNEVPPENKGSHQLTNNKLNEILKESHWVSKDCSRNDANVSSVPNKQLLTPETIKSSEETQQCLLKVFPCQSVNHPLYFGINNSTEVVQNDPTVLRGHVKSFNSNAGTGVVLPYYETLMENDVHVGAPSTLNKERRDESLSDKMQNKDRDFLQTMIMQNKQKEGHFVLNNTSNYAVSGQFPDRDDINSTSSIAECHESIIVTPSQGARNNSVSLGRLDSPEDIIQNVSNSDAEYSTGLSVGGKSKVRFNSLDDIVQEGSMAASMAVSGPQTSDNENLLSSSMLKDNAMREKRKQSLPEVCSQKAFQNINISQKELAQCNQTEKCSAADYIKTDCRSNSERIPDVFGYQTEPSEIQAYGASRDLCVGLPDNSAVASETLLESINQPLWKNAHYDEHSARYNMNSCVSKYSAGLLKNSPATLPDVLVDSREDKCKIDAVCFGKTKYFESESVDLDVPILVSDDLSVNQKDDESKICSAVGERERTDTQHDEITKEVVGVDQKQEQSQDSFQICHGIKEKKLCLYPEDYIGSSGMKLPEKSLLTYQSLEKINNKETKSLTLCTVEDVPTYSTFKSSNNLSTFETSNLPEDSKSLKFRHLDDSLQNISLTDRLSSTFTNPHSLQERQEREFPRAFPKVSYPSLKMFSEYPLTADLGYNETSRYDVSHTTTSNCSAFDIVQMQESQSDDAVIFDQQPSASTSIVLSLTNEKGHLPIADTKSTSQGYPAEDGKSIHKSNSEQLNNETEVDKQPWDKVSLQQAFLENLRKVEDGVSMSSSLAVGDARRATLNKQENMRERISRNEKEMHSNMEKVLPATDRKQRRTFLRKDPVENQTIAPSVFANELMDPQITISQNPCSGNISVDSRYMYNLYGGVCPTDNNAADPKETYHTASNFEINSCADLQDNWQVGHATEKDQSRANVSSGKDMVHCKNNACSNVDSPDNFPIVADNIMKIKRKTSKSERQNLSVMKNENMSFKILPENSCLPPQEPKLVLLRNEKSYFTAQNTKHCKQDEQRNCLQNHILSAPAISAISDLEYTSEVSSKAHLSLYPASKSLQELNMSVEPPSPTEDDLHGIERFSKLESDNFILAKYKPRLQQRLVQTQRLANYDPKSSQNYGERSRGSNSLEPSAIHYSTALAHRAGRSMDIEAKKHSNNTSLPQCNEETIEELRDQPEETDLFLQDNKDAMHFSSSDINPYIHPWQQNGLCKIGWKQYVFGSASDVSCSQPPLSLDNHKVMRCSSVDNGLNSQNSPFHSHLSSYANAKVLSSTLSSIEDPQGWDDARQGFESTYSSDNSKHYVNVSSEILQTNPKSRISKFENPSEQPGNTSMQVDEIVLLYPSESETASKKTQGITCEQGTQTMATGRYKRQKRHRRSYTDVSARKQDASRSSFQRPSSWASMQNLSMHLSQLLHNTSELLGNLSQQNVLDNEQSAKINQRGIAEEIARAAMSDSCTQTTGDVGIQADISEHPQSKNKENLLQAKIKNELMKTQEVNVIVKVVGSDTVCRSQEKKDVGLTIQARTPESIEMRLQSMPDFNDSAANILGDSFMHLPSLARASTPILDFQKPPFSAQQNVAFGSPRVSPVVSSSLSSGQDESPCTVVSSSTSSTSQSPAHYTQDKRTVDESDIAVERKLCYKNTLLVDRASSPILTLSANPSNQVTCSKSICSIKGSVEHPPDTSSLLSNQKKQGSHSCSGFGTLEPHVDNSSQTETDNESTTSRNSKEVSKKSGSFSDKNTAKEFLGIGVSKELKENHRFTVDAHTTIRAKRLYHSSSTLEVSGHGEYLVDDLKEHVPMERSLHCMYVTRRGRGSSGRIRYDKTSGSSDASLIKNHSQASFVEECRHSPPNSDLLFNQEISTCWSSKTNADGSPEHQIEASSAQFHHSFWKNQNSCPFPLSKMSDMHVPLQDDDAASASASECNTEILLNENASLVKTHRPRSYSLRDLPLHNKFINWCGVKGSPPSSVISLTGSAADLQNQMEKKPVSKQGTETEGKSQPWESRTREIERLRRERAQIMSGIHLDMKQHPLTVELTEAKLNYGIGETDALLRILQNGTGEDLTSVPIKQQLYERHMKTIEALRKQREERLQSFRRTRSLSPQKHLSLMQTLDTNQRDLDLPSRRREYLQQLRRNVVENTRVQEPKRRISQYPSEIELLLRDYQRAREEAKTEIARARDKLRERAEQEKRRIREQIFSHLQKEEAKLKTLVSTSTLCTDSSLSLSSGPTSGYNSSNAATYAAGKLSKQEALISPGNAELPRGDTRGRSAVRNSQLYVLEQLQKNSACESSRVQPPLPSASISHKFSPGLTLSVSSSPTKEYQDLSKHILANAITEVMAACSNNLRNFYNCQAAADWKYQCTEKEVLVYYKVFPSATKHGFLGAGVIERPLPNVWCMVKDPGKRHLYDKTINTAQVHKVMSHIQLVYLVSDTSLCYLKQPRDFCCITVEAKEENLSILAIQSIYDESMPRPCKEMVRGEILPSAWILEPDRVNGKDITRVIYMAQVDLGAPAIPARLLSSIVKRQPLVIARLAHFFAS